MQFFSAYSYIWRFSDPEELKYEQYARSNDLTSFRLYTISIILICLSFLIVDLNRPVVYQWVFVFRFGLALIYGGLLTWLYYKNVTAREIQIILTLQFLITYVFYFCQAALANMPIYFLPNVLMLFFYTSMTISGLRFRYALFINIVAFIVFVLLAAKQDNEIHMTQFPNLAANLMISIISGAFIEKQKRKDFMQYSELLRQKDELGELNQQKNRIISILSHDIASPLRSIGGLLTTYEKNQITKEELDRFLPEVKTRLDKVSFLVYSLVRWSKSQMQGFTVQRIPVNAESLIMENVQLIKPFAGEKSITIHTDCEPGLQACVDQEMVNLIVRNLLSNAVKFTPNGKHIFIKAFRQDDKAIFQISNEGDSIPDSVREKLFTFQVKSGQGTANETGTGLGLAMSQQFAVLNGGKISLEERSASMNTFRVELSAVR